MDLITYPGLGWSWSILAIHVGVPEKDKTVTHIPQTTQSSIFSNTAHGLSFNKANPNSLPWRHNEPDGASNHQPLDCLLNRLFRRRSKKTSKLRVSGLCEGNSPVTCEFLSQRASNAKNVSIWWRHHVSSTYSQQTPHNSTMSVVCEFNVWFISHVCFWPLIYFTKMQQIEVHKNKFSDNSSYAKPPLNFNGSLAKLGSTSLIKHWWHKELRHQESWHWPGNSPGIFRYQHQTGWGK